MVILLGKYKKLAKNVSPDLLHFIDKLNGIFQECRKKNISEQFSSMDYFELEDVVAKLIL